MPNVNRKAPNKTHTQTIICAIDDGWTESNSRKWCKDNDYYVDGHEETENSHRWRQYDPDSGKFRYRNKGITGDGKPITLVIGFLKGSKEDSADIQEGLADKRKGNKMQQGIFMREYSAETKDVTVDIIGVIGWQVWYSAMRDILRQIPETAERVIFEIYSPGGDVWEGNAIIQEIGALKQKTLARVQVAASMATLIAVACQEREIAKNGRWLIHNPWTGLQGDADAFEKRAKELRDCENEFAKFYADRTGRTQKEIFDLMEEERWLTPKETLELGFVQKINDPFDQSAFAELRKEIEAAGKWPKALQEIPEEKQEGKENIMKKKQNEEGKTNDANPTGAESNGAATITEPDKPADAESYSRGFRDGKTEAETNHAAQLIVVAGKIEDLTGKNTALDTLQRKTQGERDSARAQVEKLDATLKEATAKLEQLLAGGMSFSAPVETWEEAMEKCGNVYEQARKKYPDLFRAERERAKANRK